jgi:hypothetical protein
MTQPNSAGRPARSGIALFAAGCVLAGAPFATAETVRRFEERHPTDAIGGVALEAPVGELRITGADVDEVRIAVAVRCPEDRDRCREAAERVRLAADSTGGQLALAVKGWPDHGDKGMKLALEVEMPRDLALAIELGVGEVEVAGLGDDIEIDLGVGETAVRLFERLVRAVKVDVGVGEARLTVGGHTIEGSGFLGRSIDWTRGHGRARVEVDCGVGEAVVTVE